MPRQIIFDILQCCEKHRDQINFVIQFKLQTEALFFIICACCYLVGDERKAALRSCGGAGQPATINPAFWKRSCWVMGSRLKNCVRWMRPDKSGAASHYFPPDDWNTADHFEARKTRGGSGGQLFAALWEASTINHVTPRTTASQYLAAIQTIQCIMGHQRWVAKGLESVDHCRVYLEGQTSNYN